jgi:hypothetical protein
LNTSSHSGWIVSGLVEQETAADKVGIPLAPEPMFYAKYVLEKLGSKIAITVKGIEYSKELDLLLPKLKTWVENAKLSVFQKLVGKILSISIPRGYFEKAILDWLSRPN